MPDFGANATSSKPPIISWSSWEVEFFPHGAKPYRQTGKSRQLPGIVRADCGDNALAFLTGISPEKWRAVRRERYGLKRMDGTPDEIMLELLHEKGMETLKLTPEVIQTVERNMLTPLTDLHVILYSARSTKGEQSWFVQWGGLTIHNLEGTLINPTTHFNWLPSASYLVRHPSWEGPTPPSLKDSMDYLIRTMLAEKMVREGKFLGLSAHVDLEQFELPTDPDSLEEMMELLSEEAAKAKKDKLKAALASLGKSTTPSEPEEESEEDDEEDD